MRNLTSNELAAISGGSTELAIIGVAIGLTVIYAICSRFNTAYTSYEVITPLYDSYGNYTGYDQVETYVVPYYY